MEQQNAVNRKTIVVGVGDTVLAYDRMWSFRSSSYQKAKILKIESYDAGAFTRLRLYVEWEPKKFFLFTVRQWIDGDDVRGVLKGS